MKFQRENLKELNYICFIDEETNNDQMILGVIR